MKKQELLSILITLVVGFFAGSFLYLNTFAGMVGSNDVDSLEEQESFSITSQAYGGCRENCPAFRVNSDGSFRYQYVPEVGAEPLVRSGELPRRLERELGREITTSALASQTAQINSTNCASFTDGIDITYEVVIDGTTYVLDSCRTDIDPTSEAWQALGNVWSYFTEISE
jgi:hypothetical protein